MLDLISYKTKFHVRLNNHKRPLECRTVFLDIPVHTSTVYFNETGVPPLRLRALSEKYLEFKLARFGQFA